MAQKDPNNISGLLKMHLRENNLLSQHSVQCVSDALKQDMVSELSTPYIQYTTQRVSTDT